MVIFSLCQVTSQISVSSNQCADLFTGGVQHEVGGEGEDHGEGEGGEGEAEVGGLGVEADGEQRVDHRDVALHRHRDRQVHRQHQARLHIRR